MSAVSQITNGESPAEEDHFFEEEIYYRIDVFARTIITLLGGTGIAAKSILIAALSVISFGSLSLLTEHVCMDSAKHDMLVASAFFYTAVQAFFQGMKDPVAFHEQNNPSISEYGHGVVQWIIYRPYKDINPDTLYTLQGM